MSDDDAAYLAVQRLQRAYADIATRGAWHEAARILTPDARISFDTRTGKEPFEIEGAAQFGEFGAKLHGAFTFYEYIPLNFVVTFASGDTGHGRTYSLEVSERADSGVWAEIYGVYDDDYALFEGSWRFSGRRYRTYGRRTADQLEAFGLDS